MSTRCVLVGSWLVLCVLAVNIAVVRVKAGGPVAKAAVLAAVVHVLSIPDFPVVAAVAPEVGAHLRMLRCRSARRRCVIFPPPARGHLCVAGGPQVTAELPLERMSSACAGLCSLRLPVAGVHAGCSALRCHPSAQEKQHGRTNHMDPRNV